METTLVEWIDQSVGLSTISAAITSTEGCRVASWSMSYVGISEMERLAEERGFD